MNITQLKQGSLNGLRRQTNECIDNAYRKGYEDGKKEPREVTNVEDTNEYQIGYKMGLEDGAKAQNEAQYSKGSEDARQTLLNLLKIPSGEWGNMFDRDSYYVEAIFKHYSINEIAERIKAYEEKKKAEDEIGVGDEVYLLDPNEKSVVTFVDKENRMLVILTIRGKYATLRISDAHKTGRHFGEVEQIIDKLRCEEK